MTDFKILSNKNRLVPPKQDILKKREKTIRAIHFFLTTINAII
jgi:hypothetical protein